MARVGLREAEALSGGERQSNWFTLVDDRDVRKVRILEECVDDIDVFSVHRIEVGKRDRWISCLRVHPDDPIEDCPLCANTVKKAAPRVFLQMVDVADGKVYIWDRGLNIIQKLRGIEKRIQGPLFQTVIEIERHGRKGSQTTEYEFYAGERNTNLKRDELPAKVNLEASGIIMSENAKSIEVFLETGDFPGWGVNADTAQTPSHPKNEAPDIRPRGGDVASKPEPRPSPSPTPVTPAPSAPSPAPKPEITLPTSAVPIITPPPAAPAQTPAPQPAEENTGDKPVPERRHPRVF